MINELIKTGCIKVGNFKLKNGDFSKYYFDMKHLVSYPELLSKIGDQIYLQIMNNMLFSGMVNIENIRIVIIRLHTLIFHQTFRKPSKISKNTKMHTNRQ